jgi:hypothetical protein
LIARFFFQPIPASEEMMAIPAPSAIAGRTASVSWWAPT